MWRRLLLTFLSLFIYPFERTKFIEKDNNRKQFFRCLEYPIRYSSLPSCQTTEVNELTLVNEPRDAFTATYLLRRLNSKYSKYRDDFSIKYPYFSALFPKSSTGGVHGDFSF